MDRSGKQSKKLKLTENPSQRRVKLAKGRDGLRKKARELATLCDVDACVLVYGKEGEPTRPQDLRQGTVHGEEGEPSSQPQPVVWPEDQEAARAVIERFKSTPEVKQRDKMLDGVSLPRERVAKLEQQVNMAESDVRVLETRLLLHDAINGRLAGLTMQHLGSLDSMAKDLAMKIRERIAQLRAQQQPPLPYGATTAANVDAPPPPHGRLMEVIKAAHGDDDDITVLGNGGGNVRPGGGMTQLGNPSASSPPEGPRTRTHAFVYAAGSKIIQRR